MQHYETKKALKMLLGLLCADHPLLGVQSNFKSSFFPECAHLGGS